MSIFRQFGRFLSGEPVDVGGPVAVLRGLQGYKGKVSTQDCVQHFLDGDDCTSGGSLRADNGILYSYAEPIATLTEEGVLMDCRQWSVTTSRHQGWVERFAEARGMTVECRPFQRSGSYRGEHSGHDEPVMKRIGRKSTFEPYDPRFDAPSRGYMQRPERRVDADWDPWLRRGD